jgi:hypothetical protein
MHSADTYRSKKSNPGTLTDGERDSVEERFTRALVGNANIVEVDEVATRAERRRTGNDDARQLLDRFHFKSVAVRQVVPLEVAVQLETPALLARLHAPAFVQPGG